MAMVGTPLSLHHRRLLGKENDIDPPRLHHKVVEQLTQTVISVRIDLSKYEHL